MSVLHGPPPRPPAVEAAGPATTERGEPRIGLLLLNCAAPNAAPRVVGPADPEVLLPVLLVPADRLRQVADGAAPRRVEDPALSEGFASLQRALGRQLGLEVSPMERNGVRLDPLAGFAEIAGERLDLKPKEYGLLLLFMQNGGRVVTRTQIFETVWRSREPPDRNLIDVHMSRLRSKVEGLLGRSVFKTIRGRGYQFV